METSFDTTNEPRVQALDGPELRRMDAIAQDMEYFYGPDWNNKDEVDIQMSPATKTYVARIREVAQDKPYLLIGHQYSRYLGVRLVISCVSSSKTACAVPYLCLTLF